jgi:hypothetical protein|uniref:Uncharacterized protein n=1 Tax=Siphoviridae sp. ctf8W5 TaxID=2825595 RepID=A0A8S5Q7P6_9CAUD|nr:MAG TPA: hypothetical protein [Siphoviridae sp. ctf8W5]
MVEPGQKKILRRGNPPLFMLYCYTGGAKREGIYEKTKTTALI